MVDRYKILLYEAGHRNFPGGPNGKENGSLRKCFLDVYLIWGSYASHNYFGFANSLLGSIPDCRFLEIHRLYLGVIDLYYIRGVDLENQTHEIALAIQSLEGFLKFQFAV